MTELKIGDRVTFQHFIDGCRKWRVGTAFIEEGTITGFRERMPYERSNKRRANVKLTNGRDVVCLLSELKKVE